MGERVQISRAAELETLGAFRQFIDEACRRHGVARDACHDLKLAVDEACTNIITHGYAGMNPGSILLLLDLAPERVIVELTDFGHPFEPAEPEPPDIEAALASDAGQAFGLYFIYQSMDEIGYVSREEGNTLRFVKRLWAEGAG